MTVPTRLCEVKPDTWRTVIDTNVNGPFIMARSVVPHLVRADWGRVVNVSVSHSTMRRPSLLTPWAIEGGPGVAHRHLGAGSARGRGHGQRPPSRPGHPDRDDCGGFPGQRAGHAARPRDHGAPAAVADIGRGGLDLRASGRGHPSGWQPSPGGDRRRRLQPRWGSLAACARCPRALAGPAASQAYANGPTILTLPAGYCTVLPASWPNPLLHCPLWISPELPQLSVTAAVHSAQVTEFPKFHAQNIHGPL